MLSHERNPRFTRKPNVKFAEIAVTAYIHYIPTGFWADAVTLSIEFIKIHQGEKYENASNGYRMEYNISASSSGQDAKSGLSKLEAMECFSAALNDAMQLVRDVNDLFLQGQPLIDIAQKLFEIDLPETSVLDIRESVASEVAAFALPNEMIMVEGRLWRHLAAAKAYVTARNPEAVLIVETASNREADYWWFMLSNDRTVVLGREDIPAVLASL